MFAFASIPHEQTDGGRLVTNQQVDSNTQNYRWNTIFYFIFLENFFGNFLLRIRSLSSTLNDFSNFPQSLQYSTRLRPYIQTVLVGVNYRYLFMLVIRSIITLDLVIYLPGSSTPSYPNYTNLTEPNFSSTYVST